MTSPESKVKRILSRFRGMNRSEMTSLELSVSEIVTEEIATQEQLKSAGRNSDILIQAKMDERLGSG